ncbi:ACP S-malonyltransferase [Lacticaseibacillus thailandensis]|nr:ACP S-malonyltransferase [Lacticaseibacillus thailandensis]
MSVGIAALLGAELPAPVAVMGLSLGEYAALTAAGSLSLPDGVRVVADRARWMQTAGDQVPGKMAAVMTDQVSTVQTLVQALPGVYVANKNAPRQIVVGGQVAAVDRLLAELAARGIKRVRSLNVVASHTPLMQTAADRLAARLQAVHLAPPRIPVISNTTGKPFTTATVKATLVNQLTHTTNFAGGLLALADLGVDQFVEIGPGRTLSGFVRQTLPRAARYQVHDVATFNQVRTELGVISDWQ